MSDYPDLPALPDGVAVPDGILTLIPYAGVPAYEQEQMDFMNDLWDTAWWMAGVAVVMVTTQVTFKEALQSMFDVAGGGDGVEPEDREAIAFYLS